jgi:hypothetical protein
LPPQIQEAIVMIMQKQTKRMRMDLHREVVRWKRRRRKRRRRRRRRTGRSSCD